ncbi:MAG TPA: Fis family transcriptional regulator [Syntrophaceae bacterium]|jgi:two-component system response regulator PilR (NtrC family)|nr:Fis family transcriptional regulator [Syntrophaceae bacterium]
MVKILVVDDDQGIRDMLEIMLSREGYEVTCAADANKALSRCKKEKYDLILTDLKMPKIDGIEFLKELKDICQETMVILMTAYASPETAVSAMKEGAYDYVEKGFDIEDIKTIISSALEKKGVKRDDALFMKKVEDAVSFGNMIGKSKGMLKVYSIIKKVAETPTNVLILGESGTGKELVAKAIHENSPRNNMPFVVINCGGVPESLLESELFGHVKGAFTGAYVDKPGLFEVARGGTIFLDEIGDLPSLLQVKLLRVVQEKTFRRVGGAEDKKVDIRIISATNKNLEEKVNDGSFREDLHFRLNVIPIHIPPLRERKEDIPVLTNYFIEKYSHAFGKEIKKISSYALELLMEYPFPGNVRELENIIERSVALETSNIVLPENLFLAGSVQAMNRFNDVDIPMAGFDLNEELAKYEKHLIEKALRKAKGSKTKAAEILQVSFDSLRYRIEKLGISID